MRLYVSTVLIYFLFFVVSYARRLWSRIWRMTYRRSDRLRRCPCKSRATTKTVFKFFIFFLCLFLFFFFEAVPSAPPARPSRCHDIRFTSCTLYCPITSRTRGFVQRELLIVIIYVHNCVRRQLKYVLCSSRSRKAQKKKSGRW